jgi:hypothetical protein
MIAYNYCHLIIKIMDVKLIESPSFGNNPLGWEKDVGSRKELIRFELEFGE